MAGWGEFVAAWVFFFATHGFFVRPPVKARIVAVIGARGFSLGYSAVSLAALVWLLSAAGRAPYVEIWPRALWQAWVPLVSVALAAVVLALVIGRPNPLSFGGFQNHRFDPENPGIVGWLRHPLLAAIALWAGGHLVPNGDLAHVLVFGAFLGFAFLGMKMIDRRKAREMGANWAQLSKTKRKLTLTKNGALRVTLGLGLWGLLLALHQAVIGYSPWP